MFVKPIHSAAMLFKGHPVWGDKAKTPRSLFGLDQMFLSRCGLIHNVGYVCYVLTVIVNYKEKTIIHIKSHWTRTWPIHHSSLAFPWHHCHRREKQHSIILQAVKDSCYYYVWRVSLYYTPSSTEAESICKTYVSTLLIYFSLTVICFFFFFFLVIYVNLPNVWHQSVGVEGRDFSLP